VTGELGNVSPVIVVPGPWSDSDLAYQAEHIVSSLANNAGFNCNATRVIIQHAGWDKRNALLAALRRVLAGLPSRMAYYPGAQGRYEAFLGAHPEAEKYGIAADGRLPWAFAANLDPSNHDEICFSTEPFCGFFGETALEAPSIVDFIDRAVAFANGALWGTLNATILIHPATTEFPAVAEALDRAVADLRYGSVGVNLWAGISFGLGVTTWGGYPGSSLDNIQSGTGFVHNNLMFDRPQKSVVRGEFRPKRTPLWFVSQGAMGAKVFPEMATFAAAPSPLKLLRVLAVASKKPSRGKRMRRP
jgi:hypothetical protein